MSRTVRRSLGEISPWKISQLYIFLILVWIIPFWILAALWPNLVFFSFADLWVRGDGNILHAMGSVWIIFLWGAGLTMLVGLLPRRTLPLLSPGETFRQGLWISLNAGLFEEIAYRWLRFSVIAITLPFMNLISFGIVRWLYESVLVPIADWVTFGALHEYLFHPASWVIGAAIVSANGQFRDAHRNAIQRINAWFIGMVFFWVMFNYGLLSAIVIHIVYDVLVFTSGAFTDKVAEDRIISRQIRLAREAIHRAQ